MSARHTLLLAAMCGLSACKSPQEQLHHLLVKYPELVRTDSTTVEATAYVPGDTLQARIVYLPGDTVRVESVRQVVQVVRVPTGSPCDSAALAMDLTAQVHPDSVQMRTKVPCNTVQATRVVRETPWWWPVLVIMLVAALLLSLWKR